MWTEEDSIPRPKLLKATDDGAPHNARQKGSSEKPASVRRVGRPRGSKDSKPRRPRHQKPCAEASECAQPTLPAHCLPHNPWCNTVDGAACPNAFIPAAPSGNFGATAEESEGNYAVDAAAPTCLAAGPSERGGLRAAFPFFLTDFGHNSDAEQSAVQAPRYYWSARY
jgi:hypothetical protein